MCTGIFNRYFVYMYVYRSEVNIRYLPGIPLLNVLIQASQWTWCFQFIWLSSSGSTGLLCATSPVSQSYRPQQPCSAFFHVNTWLFTRCWDTDLRFSCLCSRHITDWDISLGSGPTLDLSDCKRQCANSAKCIFHSSLPVSLIPSLAVLRHRQGSLCWWQSSWWCCMPDLCVPRHLLRPELINKGCEAPDER